jgi:hypothetical protein
MAVRALGDGPSAAEVEARLAALGGAEAHAAGEVVEIGDVDGRLTLTFQREGATATRELPRPRGCNERAEVVAAVILAWQGEGPPLLTVRAAPSARSALAIDLDAAVVGALANTAFTPGATAGARIGFGGGRFGARVGLLGEGERGLNLSAGQVAWGRSALRVGADARLVRQRFTLDLHADGLLALLYVRGRGYEEAFRRYDVDAGLGVGVRAGVRAGPVTPYLAVDAVGWLRPEAVYVVRDGASFSADLPRFELLFAAGVALGLGRRH